MSREFPDWINPWAAAQGGRLFQGSWPLKRMKRLAKELVTTEGDARFELRLSLDTDQRPNIALAVEAELQLMCQASLKPFTWPVQHRTLLGVVETMAEEPLLPDHLDPVLVESGRLAIVDLVEDELLLALPQIPRNPELKPIVREWSDQQAPKKEAVRENPFATLAALKTSQGGKKLSD